MDIISNLQSIVRDHIKREQTLRFAYAGGSKPGSIRTIRPTACNNDIMRGFDRCDHRSKAYKLELILAIYDDADNALCTQNVPAYPWPATAPPISIEDMQTIFGPIIEAHGWALHSSDSNIGAGGWVKNGKPRKTPTIDLAHYADMPRPWFVYSPRFNRGRSTQDPTKAARIFHDELMALRPTDNA